MGAALETLDQFASPLIYGGTYQRDYPRNRLTIEALRRSGYDVLELNEPVWNAASRASSGQDGWFGWGPARLIASFLAAYPKLVWRVGRQLLRSSALVIGYPGQVDMLVLGSLAKLWRKPVIFNPLVTLTDMIVEDRELVNARSVAGRCIRLVDQIALRLADLVVVDTRENGDYVEQRFAVPPAKIVVIPVGADQTVFDPTRHSKFQSESSSVRPLRALFYGKYIPLHGVEKILRAARILQDRDEPVDLELIGAGQTYAAMRDLADELELKNVCFVGPVPYTDLPSRIAAADVVLGIFGETDKAARVIPNKVFQAMAMGSAIITRRSPAVEVMLQDRVSALLVDAGPADELAAAIQSLRDATRREELGRAARRAFEAFAGPDVLAEQVGAAIRLLLRSGESHKQPIEAGSVQ